MILTIFKILLIGIIINFILLIFSSKTCQHNKKNKKISK
jgi:hypothetical protein